MEESSGIYLILIIDLIVAILFGKLATKKGYPGIVLGGIGFFLPILYLIILLLPKRDINHMHSDKNN